MTATITEAGTVIANSTPLEARPALEWAVNRMCAAADRYYDMVRTLSTTTSDVAIDHARRSRDAYERIAAATVPVDVHGHRLHACGHVMYPYENNKLAALAGLDPCEDCSYRDIYDDRLHCTVTVFRYRIIGSTIIEHVTLVADAAVWGRDARGGRFSSIQGRTVTDAAGERHITYGKVDTYFNDSVFEGLAAYTDERSTKVLRWFRLAATHARRMAHQAWPEDYPEHNTLHEGGEYTTTNGTAEERTTDMEDRPQDDLQEALDWWLAQYECAKRAGDERGMDRCANEVGMLRDEIKDRDRDAVHQAERKD